MFKNLTNFNYQRSPKEAVGFFMAYFFFAFLFSILLGVIIGIINQLVWFMPSDIVIETGTILGVVLERIISIFFLFIFLSKKNLSHKVGVIFTGIFLGIFGLLFGFIPLLIPVSYLTTIPVKKEKEPETEEEKENRGKLFKNDRKGKIFLILFALVSIIFLLFLYQIIALLDNILYEVEILQILETMNDR